jgi:hypothetical protein
MNSATNKAETTLAVGARVKIDKGCSAKVTEIAPMGAEYSHCVRVVLAMSNGFKAGKTFAFYARHPNRLGDIVIRMNDGNPLHVIEIVRAS